ncbi:MAG TPA: hypothetical protein HA292_01305 [Candidatus Nitrosotenuis sp.]|nr:hypothetical protein [Candidatus Nitrosotenuis sp.]HIH67879.1 hypothetical protein [Candidatus Nitrosotenuis sp.]
MTYSIWLVPEKVDSLYLDRIIKNLAKLYFAPKFSPHITIYGGVRDLDAAKVAVSKIKSKRVIAINNGIGQSDYLWKTLFINIKKTSNLRKIHNTLQQNLDSNYKFNPHISLIYKKLDKTTKKTIRHNIKLKKRFTFNKIVIIKSSSNPKKWKKCYSSSIKTNRRVHNL